MTDEEIISAADACGMMLFGLGMDKAKFEFCLLAFAKFVGKIERFKEREACAKLLESRKTGANELMDLVRDMGAKAIRARGEAKLKEKNT